MKKYLIVLLLLAALYGSALAATPPGRYIGEFYFGDKVFEFNQMEYKVAIVYRGTNNGVMLVFLLSSPSNPFTSGGYGYLKEEGSGSNVYFALDLGGLFVYLVPTPGNRVKVWINP